MLVMLITVQVAELRGPGRWPSAVPWPAVWPGRHAHLFPMEPTGLHPRAGALAVSRGSCKASLGPGLRRSLANSG